MCLRIRQAFGDPRSNSVPPFDFLLVRQTQSKSSVTKPKVIVISLKGIVYPSDSTALRSQVSSVQTKHLPKGSMYGIPIPTFTFIYHKKSTKCSTMDPMCYTSSPILSKKNTGNSVFFFRENKSPLPKVLRRQGIPRRLGAGSQSHTDVVAEDIHLITQAVLVG